MCQPRSSSGEGEADTMALEQPMAGTAPVLIADLAMFRIDRDQRALEMVVVELSSAQRSM